MVPLSKKLPSKAANKKIDSNLFLIVCISLIATSGIFSINPVVPNIATGLNTSPQEIGLIMTAFLLPTTLGSPIGGALADRFGRKKILIPSLILFGIGGVLCALATNFRSLVEWRFLTGIGAASLESVELTIISDLYSGKMLTAAMGFNSAMIGVAATIYPLIGGALAAFNWRYTFLLSVLALPLALLIGTKLQLPTQQKTTENLDWKSYLKTTWINLKNPQVIGLLFTVFSMFIIELGAFYIYLPIYAGKFLNAAGAQIGLLLSTDSIAFALAASQLGLLVRWFSEKTLIVAGFVIGALSLLMIPAIHNVWLLLIPCVIAGASQALVLPPLQSMLAAIAPEGYRAGFMALNVTVQSLGRALGPLFGGITFAAWGIAGVFYANVALSLITVVVFSLLLRKSNSKPSNA
ncbi:MULTISPECIES: MFS transporter [Calothrix]|uniref:MFS transporter n=2 Tax=Calothrix TaxID=1186 RepID=A0ABR8A6P6_9CYAN|nr:MULTISPECIES: MFS transporter [Calothrix]MBD2195504.1 MFS transporter [Calothrix parietina FACHB-288]MBD2228408.1 MFS transporter [Calothrix anomala FACHB-343]